MQFRAWYDNLTKKNKTITHHVTIWLFSENKKITSAWYLFHLRLPHVSLPAINCKSRMAASSSSWVAFWSSSKPDWGRKLYVRKYVCNYYMQIIIPTSTQVSLSIHSRGPMLPTTKALRCKIVQTIFEVHRQSVCKTGIIWTFTDGF